ncbi:ATP-binding protein [Brevibacterium sp. 'Marine']|uniref:ATP-binding protein n=1 Tax=Brevibacterium sp. 'Marine' TaxID=2725563 RepID=UPI00145C9CE9|nr:ATP-binding protein [Brevibacterium sp. 'Marine']
MTEQRRSPFALQPGTVPPVLVERQSFINDFAYALDSGHGAMGRSTLVTGESGMGKSTMLTVFEEVATSRSWATVHLPGGAGLVERLAEAQIPRLLDDEGHGVLITVDDIDRAPLPDLEQVAGTVADAFAEGIPLALAFTGPADATNALFAADAIPYLARSARVDLERLSDDGMRLFVSTALADSGKSITEGAVRRLLEAADGNPRRLLAIADLAWKHSGDRAEISEEDVRAALPEGSPQSSGSSETGFSMQSATKVRNSLGS